MMSNISQVSVSVAGPVLGNTIFAQHIRKPFQRVTQQTTIADSLFGVFR